MKNQKLNLEELKVDSFVTKKSIKGGAEHPLSWYIGYYAHAVYDAVTKISNDCPEYSEAVDCSMSA